jgi:hypothetical protein
MTRPRSYNNSDTPRFNGKPTAVWARPESEPSFLKGVALVTFVFVIGVFGAVVLRGMFG